MPDHSVCCEYATFTKKIIKFMYYYHAILMVVVTTIFVLWPCFTHKIMMPLVIIGVDLNTAKGLAICMVGLVAVTPWALIILCQAEVLIVFIFVNMPMVSAIITHNIRQLEIDIKNGIDSNIKIEIRTVLIHIILLHRKYKEYVFD